MCGIVAFKGDKEITSKVIFDGLELLEYRGYDSCGIGVIDDNEIKTFKWKGRVKKTKKKFNDSNIKSSCWFYVVLKFETQKIAKKHNIEQKIYGEKEQKSHKLRFI